ncbi:STAS domain-containing protein [Micromonospora sp. R77]|uniref:STAS domain-containing protein n=1 Tax=Micromonospora sp. R77 TaxID=2925836 RepID=UPI001F61BF2A|nr:STAS domain-containing protein [Micromonospora sp. R77]MCI4063975.1 STAS domain-containing protein [Micromonospora sp. R77]
MVQVSGDHFVINVLTAPRPPAALVCLAGEIDMDADPALAGVVDRLSAVAPSEVVVDLADVTFASSTLLNFLARAHLALTADTALIVCRPGPHTRRLLEMTGVGKLVTMRGDLPPSGYWMPHAAARPEDPPALGDID